MADFYIEGSLFGVIRRHDGDGLSGHQPFARSHGDVVKAEKNRLVVVAVIDGQKRTASVEGA